MAYLYMSEPTNATDAVKVLFDDLVKSEHLTSVVPFYQFISAVFSFVSSDQNYNTYFSNLASNSERQTQLKGVLMLGNHQFFNDSPSNKEWIDNIFNTSTSVGAISAVVLQFMILIQDASKGQISGDRKFAFVRNSVVSLLRFSPLTADEQALAIAGLDVTIQSLILVKNGALKGVVAEVEVVAKNLGCWCFK